MSMKIDLDRISQAVREQDGDVPVYLGRADQSGPFLELSLICNGDITVWESGEIETDYMLLKTQADRQLMRAVLDAIEVQVVEAMERP